LDGIAGIAATGAAPVAAEAAAGVAAGTGASGIRGVDPGPAGGGTAEPVLDMSDMMSLL
jgi:hypothetical protein